MAKATNLTRKKHDKPSAKIDEDGRHLFGVANWVHIHLKPTSMCGINVVGGGGGNLFFHWEYESSCGSLQKIKKDESSCGDNSMLDKPRTMAIKMAAFTHIYTFLHIPV